MGLLREPLLWQEAPRALAAVPLASGSNLYGFLLLAFDRSRSFGPDERVFLQIVGDALALVLEREELRRSLDLAQQHAHELERRLNHDQECATGLVSVVAHEMNTPLSAIHAYAETLQGSLDNPQAPRERFLATIREECRRLTRLVTDILSLSRLEVGQRPLRISSVNLRRLLDETIETLRPQWEPRRIRIETRVDAALCVESDADLLRQLWINLIHNAVKYSPDGGCVEVAAREDQENWHGEVRDHGPGVAPEDAPHLFERFYRARGGAAGVEGTGLGLAIARSIVDLHGGQVALENPPEGGCRLHFRLPLRQRASDGARRVAARLEERQDLAALFEATVEMVAVMLEAEIVSLMLVHPEHGDLHVAASFGLEPDELAGRRIPLRAGVAGMVAAWGKPVKVENIETDRRFRRLNHPQYATKSLLCVPLRVGNEVVGAFNVSSKQSREAFNEDDLSVLVALVERIGSVADRACTAADSGRTVSEALETVQSIIRLRREHRLGGSKLVSHARATAQALGLPAREVDVIGFAAGVHDLGMTRLDGFLVNGRPTLNSDERSAIMQHPEVGVELIRPLEYMGSVRETILSHHEWWDGTGYPRGLQGEEIPMGARILAVVDAFDSMTAGRPYRAPISVERAMAELERQSGSQFDPGVVDAFTRTIHRQKAAG